MCRCFDTKVTRPLEGHSVFLETFEAKALTCKFIQVKLEDRFNVKPFTQLSSNSPAATQQDKRNIQNVSNKQ